jgi:hypothetical protein
VDTGLLATQNACKPAHSGTNLGHVPTAVETLIAQYFRCGHGHAGLRPCRTGAAGSPRRLGGAGGNGPKPFNVHTDSTPGDDTLTTYEFVIEEVNLALLRLARALSADDPTTIEQECAEAWGVYRGMVHLYPKLQLEPTQRDSLLGQMTLLRSRLEECEGRRSTAVDSL